MRPSPALRAHSWPIRHPRRVGFWPVWLRFVLAVLAGAAWDAPAVKQVHHRLVGNSVVLNMSVHERVAEGPGRGTRYNTTLTFGPVCSPARAVSQRQEFGQRKTRRVRCLNPGRLGLLWGMHDALLAVIRRFIALAPAEEALVRGWFVAEALPKGGFFLQPGEVSRKVGFVVRGVFHNFRRRDGDEHTYYFAREQEFIGDYESFLPARPAVHAIQALEAAQLLTISHDNLQRLYREVREGEKFGRLVAEALFVDVLRQLTSFYEETPEERYARFVRTYPDLQQRVPQYYIASYVGVRPQSLSRIRARASA